MGWGNGIAAALKAGALGRTAILKGRAEGKHNDDALMLAIAKFRLEQEREKRLESRSASSEQRAIETHDAAMRAAGYYRPENADSSKHEVDNLKPREFALDWRMGSPLNSQPGSLPGNKSAPKTMPKERTPPTRDGSAPRLDPATQTYQRTQQAPAGWAFSPDSTATARKARGTVEGRAAEIRAWNENQPEDKRLPETSIKTISSSPVAFGLWARKANGLDGTTAFKERRTFAIEHPLPSRAAAHTKATTPAGKSSLGVVQKQLTESRSDLNRAEASVAKRPYQFRTPADSTAFEEKKTRVGALRARVDSLGAVRDSIANEVQGKKQPTTSVKKPLISPSEYSALRAQGFSDDDIHSKYTVVGGRK